MNSLSYRTVSANKNTVKKEWIVIDAKKEVLGRLASKVAFVLRGKHKTEYTPHVDCGDNVIIINAEQVDLTGLKWADKIYMSHSGYPGGQKTIIAEELMKKKPTAMIEKAVKGMLPKSRLGSDLFRNMKVFVGDNDPHYLEMLKAQKAKEVKLTTIK